MAEIAWDLELLEMIRNHLERISQYLQEHVNVLTRIQEQANGEWQSEAGRAYSSRIETDIRELSDLQNDYSVLANKVSEVRRNYASGEVDIHSALLDSLTNLSIPF